ncbi:hypothetical protein CEXT_111491 [Caerostris extrusa]|uniref:Uncharacterized protein n=1 Tax=Caerostris extrusa TaxID=172846 RepID=A0AAV4W4E5_CAEEX|nr:hypothetical protein CEXT_111491 [Caerostris extrusa]
MTVTTTERCQTANLMSHSVKNTLDGRRGKIEQKSSEHRNHYKQRKETTVVDKYRVESQASDNAGRVLIDDGEDVESVIVAYLASNLLRISFVGKRTPELQKFDKQKRESLLQIIDIAFTLRWNGNKYPTKNEEFHQFDLGKMAVGVKVKGAEGTSKGI